jgi:hypothetical protein
MDQQLVSERLRDILDELVDLRTTHDALCAEAVTLHERKTGDHVRTDKGGQGVVLHVGCKLCAELSHYKLVVTEHIAPLSSITGRPMTARLHRTYVLAEEWLITPTEI